MAAKTLYIKTSGTSSPQSSDDGLATGGWVDAYTTWGLSLSETGISRLMTPAPHKQPVYNSNVISDGKAVMQNTFYHDVRQVSLEVHITAKAGGGQTAKENFITQYSNFCTQVLGAGYIEMRLGFQPSVIYKFIYLDCTQFSEFKLEMAKFTLTLEEPNPADRSLL